MLRIKHGNEFLKVKEKKYKKEISLKTKTSLNILKKKSIDLNNHNQVKIESFHNEEIYNKLKKVNNLNPEDKKNNKQKLISKSIIIK